MMLSNGLLFMLSCLILRRQPNQEQVERTLTLERGLQRRKLAYVGALVDLQLSWISSGQTSMGPRNSASIELLRSVLASMTFPMTYCLEWFRQYQVHILKHQKIMRILGS